MTSLYLICCILRIVKIKDLANTIAAALFFPVEAFKHNSETKHNGYMTGLGFVHESQPPGNDNLNEVEMGELRVNVANVSSSSHIHSDVLINQVDCGGSQLPLR